MVLQRPTAWDRIGVPVFALVCFAASALAAWIAAPVPFGWLFAVCFAGFGLLLSMGAWRAWTGGVVTLVADRDARELRCVDGLHAWSRAHTRVFALDEIFTIESRRISANVDEGPPFAVQVRDGSLRGADLARFGDEADATRAARDALDLLTWLRQEAGEARETE